MDNGADIRPSGEIARRAGILEAELHPYGKHVAKVDLSLLHRLRNARHERMRRHSTSINVPKRRGAT